jgi:hypothetical protein
MLLMPARKFDENYLYRAQTLRGDQSDRLTASGVMWRAPGVARCPPAV